MSRFEGKRILITGGTSGIGLATAKRIVDEGGEVAVTGTTQEHLDEAGKALPSGSLVLRNDASDPEAAKELAQKVRDQMVGVERLYAVHDTKGERLALVKDRKLAFALARQHDLAPVNAH